MSTISAFLREDLLQFALDWTRDNCYPSFPYIAVHQNIESGELLSFGGSQKIENVELFALNFFLQFPDQKGLKRVFLIKCQEEEILEVVIDKKGNNLVPCKVKPNPQFRCFIRGRLSPLAQP